MVTDNIIQESKTGDAGVCANEGQRMRNPDELGSKAKLLENLWTSSIPPRNRLWCGDLHAGNVLGIHASWESSSKDVWAEGLNCAVVTSCSQPELGSPDGPSESSWTGAMRPGLCTSHHQPVIECELCLGLHWTRGTQLRAISHQESEQLGGWESQPWRVALGVLSQWPPRVWIQLSPDVYGLGLYGWRKAAFQVEAQGWFLFVSEQNNVVQWGVCRGEQAGREPGRRGMGFRQRILNATRACTSSFSEQSVTLPAYNMIHICIYIWFFTDTNMGGGYGGHL